MRKRHAGAAIALGLAVALVSGQEPTGEIRGQVLWLGPPAEVPPLRQLRPKTPAETPNPHTPRVGPKGGVADAIVHLKIASGKPAFPQVTVTFADGELRVTQGGRTGRAGVVGVGDAIVCVSREKAKLHLLGRGAVFLSLPLFEPNVPVERKLDRPGWVDLLPGVDRLGLRARIWVSEHPFAAVTDDDGRFAWTGLPLGKHTVVCRLPSWRVERHERNAETSEIERIWFEAPIEFAVEVDVTAGSPIPLTIPVSASAFAKARRE